MAENNGNHQTQSEGKEYLEMTFLDHLEELRRRLIRVVIALVLGAIGGYLVSDPMLRVITVPVGKLYFFSPPEAFLVRLKISLVASLLIFLPYLLLELWWFVKPGLTKEERKTGFPLLIVSVLLFYLGFAFALMVVIPVGVKVLIAFGGSTMESLFNASGYVNFVLILILVFGVLFQFPILILFLTKIGLIEPESLRKRRREVIVGAFVVAAIVTPSVDFVTQTLLAVPLIILFELGLFATRFVKTSDRR